MPMRAKGSSTDGSGAGFLLAGLALLVAATAVGKRSTDSNIEAPTAEYLPDET